MRCSRYFSNKLTGAVGLALVFSFSTSAQAAEQAAFFVSTVDGSSAKARKTGALLDWMMTRLVDHEASKKKGFTFLKRGLFFSKSRALGARKWMSRVKAPFREAMKSYTSKPAVALSAFRRASQFFHYAHPYYLQRSSYQTSLLHLSMLLYRKKEKESAWRFLTRGILMQPGVIPQGALRPAERKVIEAGRCRLANGNKANLIIKTKTPGTAVYINDHLVGFGTLRLNNLPAGEYYISTREAGYRRWGRKRFRLPAGATRTVYARNMSSPQASFYRSLCKELMLLKEGEQLNDKMKDVIRTLQLKSNKKRAWIGCYKPDKSQLGGTIHWFTARFTGDSGTAKRGTIPVPAGFEEKFQVLATLTRAMGYSTPSKLPSSSMLYPILKKRASCPNFDTLLNRFMHPIVKYVILYTKLGFRVQGRLIRKTQKNYFIEVASSTQPTELKTVKVPVSMVRFKWDLGGLQQQGFRLGERIVVQTIFGVSTSGTLVSIDVEEVKIKTKLGIESIQRPIIKSMFKRDR